MKEAKVTEALSFLLCLGSVLLAGKAQGSAQAVNSIELILPPKPSAVVENIARVFAREISQRCNASTTSASNAPLRVTLTIEPGLGTEGFKIAGNNHGAVRIIGNDERGLLYGVGRFLHSSRYNQGGFTPGKWRGTSRPKGTFRALHADTHFMNFYEAAPEPEVQAYVEDVALWGANIVFVEFPAWNFEGFDDPAARRNLERCHFICRAAKAIGLQIGMQLTPSQGFSTAPRNIRATNVPDDLGRRGSFGINCCPGTSAGDKYLIDLYARLFDEFKSTNLDYVLFWPYDEGGCGCAKCWPWGAQGYPRLARELVLAARARFPAIKSVLSTWCYDTPDAGEWEGLAAFLRADKSWLNYIMADSHIDFPRYPLDKGVPGGLPLLNFPEISMAGVSPWGGFGANPLPARLQDLWNHTERKPVGGMPYSEGIYEDINKVICLQLYWQNSRSTQDILKDYLAFEYSPDVVGPLAQAIRLLEETWGRRGPSSPKAFALLQGVDRKLTPQARAAWRWRLLYLRGVIDNELWRHHDKVEGPVLKAAYDELTRLYHSEHVHGMLVGRPPDMGSDLSAE